MAERDSILKRILESLYTGMFPFSVDSNNLDRDYKSIDKRLRTRGLKSHVGMSKEKDKNKIWFYHKKKRR